MNSNSQEDRERINQMINDISDDLSVRHIEDACDLFLTSNKISTDFNSNHSWEKFQEKHGEILAQPKHNKYERKTRADETIRANRTILQKRLIAIAIAILILPVYSVAGAPIKQMIYSVTSHLFIQSGQNDDIETDNISYEGLYQSFQDVPLNIMYPDSEDIVLSNNIEIDSSNNILASLDIPQYNLKEVLFYVNQSNEKLFIEKQDTLVESLVYNGIEFYSTLNNYWMITAWDYNGYHYSFYIPRDKASADIVNTLITALHIPNNQ